MAHRVYGVTLWFAGNFIEARSHLERAAAIFDPERDRDLAFRFGRFSSRRGWRSKPECEGSLS